MYLFIYSVMNKMQLTVKIRYKSIIMYFYFFLMQKKPPITVHRLRIYYLPF